MILTDIILPSIFAIVGIVSLIILVYNVVKCMHKEADNTVRVIMQIDDAPDEIGNAIGDAFANVFATLLERRK